MKLDRDAIRNLFPDNDRDRWYEVTNKAGTAEIRIFDEISLFGVTAEQLVEDIEALGDVSDIVCRISCPGGSVFDGIAIYNALAMHPATVTTQVESLAGSAASFIVQAGDRRRMLRHSQMMIHNAQGVAAGDADTMREAATMLDQQNEVIAGIYAERAGDPDKDPAYYLDLMARSTWMTDQAAVEHSLADEVWTPRAVVVAPVAATTDPAATPVVDSDPAGDVPCPQAVNWSDLFTTNPEELIA